METQHDESIAKRSETDIGYLVGESSTTQVVARYDGDVMRGEYVIIEDSDERILGLVEEVIARDELIEETLRTDDIRKLVEDIGISESARYAKIRLLASFNELEGGRIKPPRKAPLPGTQVRRASAEELSKVFSKKDRSYIKLGVLAAHENVEFYVDLNQIVTRHLAILAVTGAGKSNTVTILAERIVKKGGVITVFDMHGEYVNALPSQYINRIEPSLDPNKLDYGSFVRLLNLRDAPKQELYIRNLIKSWNVLLLGGYYKSKYQMLDAITEMIEMMIDSKSQVKLPIIKNKELLRRAISEELNKASSIQRDPLRFLELVQRKLRRGDYNVCNGRQDECNNAMNLLDVPSSDRNSTLPSLLIKLEDMRERYKDIIDFNSIDIVDRIEKGKLNVIDLSSVDEDAADVIVSTFLKRILQERKKYVQSGGSEGFKYPIIVVLEEAHILAPKDRSTTTKYWTSRIAREGRKFGVGLCLVSQRPKGLDSDTLSQANNMIILRLVEPTDQKHVQASSESLSDDLLKQLPSLATGEAIVVGPMAPLPALVKIDKAAWKKLGSDINVVDEWENENDNVEVDDTW